MLEVSKLVAGYRGKAIAKLSTLSVRSGETALLGGPSGSGKSTLLLAIAGLADRLDGQIDIAGKDVTALGERSRDKHRGRHIGMIFQDLHLIPGLTALDNLMLAPFANGSKPDRMAGRTMLDRLGVGQRANARAETLSRGEAQRAAIARAMLVSPQLILADEPTASLDDEACDAVLDLLFEATRETGAALVIASHDARVRARVPHAAIGEPA